MKSCRKRPARRPPVRRRSIVSSPIIRGPWSGRPASSSPRNSCSTANRKDSFRFAFYAHAKASPKSTMPCLGAEGSPCGARPADGGVYRRRPKPLDPRAGGCVGQRRVERRRFPRDARLVGQQQLRRHRRWHRVHVDARVRAHAGPRARRQLGAQLQTELSEPDELLVSAGWADRRRGQRPCGFLRRRAQHDRRAERDGRLHDSGNVPNQLVRAAARG